MRELRETQPSVGLGDGFVHVDNEQECFQVDVKISCLSTLLSLSFSAYFIPQDWRPSPFLTLLTRNLILSNRVLSPDSTTIEACDVFHGGYFISTYVCSAWL